MKAERGYFRTDLKGDVHWVADDNGAWLLDPITGLRQATDPEIIAGADLLNEIEQATIAKARSYMSGDEARGQHERKQKNIDDNTL